MTEREREQFEAWWISDVPEEHRDFSKNLLAGYGKDYVSAPGVADAWEAWQAARATPAEHSVKANAGGQCNGKCCGACNYEKCVMPADQEPSIEELTQMAYELNLVPKNEIVCVQFLDVLRKQFKAAMRVRSMPTKPTADTPYVEVDGVTYVARWHENKSSYVVRTTTGQKA